MENGYTPPLDSIKTDGAERKLAVIFVIDCSKSMYGASMNAVNTAMHETMEKLQHFAATHPVNIYVSILSFTSSVKWELESELMDANTGLNNQKLEVRNGLTQYGAAYHELNKALNENRIMKHEGKVAKPVIIFMTDGAPDDNYQYDLEQLKKNGWFSNAFRNAILMGDAVGKPKAEAAVKEFVSLDGSVLTAVDSVSIVDKIELATMHTIHGNPIQDEETQLSKNIDDTWDEPEGKTGDDMNGSADDDVDEDFSDTDDPWDALPSTDNPDSSESIDDNISSSANLDPLKDIDDAFD